MQNNTNGLSVAPSGIAQLRKASDNQIHTLNAQPPTIIANNDTMNLDDFILPTSIGTPSGLSPSPSGEKMLNSAVGASHSIPIRKSVNPMEQELHLSRASMPVHQVVTQNEAEFGYVQRHVRKTSIDERRVSENRANTTLVRLSD
jgi:GATA-binding protein